MPAYQETINILTKSQTEFVDITGKVGEIVKRSKIKNGAVTVFSKHTTAAIRINQNEKLLLQDITKILYRFVPMDENYSHDIFELRETKNLDERSNAHAHIKAFILGASETIPFRDGEMTLKDWQTIFFVELDGGRKREVVVEVVGE